MRFGLYVSISHQAGGESMHGSSLDSVLVSTSLHMHYKCIAPLRHVSTLRSIIADFIICIIMAAGFQTRYHVLLLHVVSRPVLLVMS